MNKHTRVIRDLQNRTCLKVIAGINNFNKERVLQIVRAAEQMNATCVDICADEAIIKEAVANTENTAVMVSSIKVSELIRAEELGAGLLELGNYEALHAEGIYPSADEVLNWANELMTKRQSALVSVTIPGHLSVSEQVALAEKLENLGVDILQTEGASLVETKNASALGQIEKASLTLANTIEIARVVSQSYILTASGISPETVKLAIAAGAHGVGVGQYVNKLESSLEMMAAIQALSSALNTRVEVPAFD